MNRRSFLSGLLKAPLALAMIPRSALATDVVPREASKLPPPTGSLFDRIILDDVADNGTIRWEAWTGVELRPSKEARIRALHQAIDMRGCDPRHWSVYDADPNLAREDWVEIVDVAWSSK